MAQLFLPFLSFSFLSSPIRSATDRPNFQPTDLARSSILQTGTRVHRANRTSQDGSYTTLLYLPYSITQSKQLYAAALTQ